MFGKIFDRKIMINSAIKIVFSILMVLFISYTAFCGNLNDDLINAAKNGDVEKVKILIAKGANVDEIDPYGSSAIIYAVGSGNCDCVNILIKNGADTNIRNIEAWTPLLMASEAGNVAIVKTLLDNGADPNLKGLCGNWTPLMKAVYDNHPEVAQVLLRKNADINAQNDHGKTALDIAKALERNEMIELLEKASAK